MSIRFGRISNKALSSSNAPLKFGGPTVECVIGADTVIQWTLPDFVAHFALFHFSLQLTFKNIKKAGIFKFQTSILSGKALDYLIFGSFKCFQLGRKDPTEKFQHVNVDQITSRSPD